MSLDYELPKMHAREAIVRNAADALASAILEWEKNAGRTLTSAEFVQTVSHVFGDTLTSFTRTLIRMERHGRADKPGGLE